MYPDVIDQSLLDQRLPFMGIVEELSHRNRGGALRAYLLKVPVVFWRERVF